jgi:tetratricopeptide (TPR) repeat protein
MAHRKEDSSAEAVEDGRVPAAVPETVEPALLFTPERQDDLVLRIRGLLEVGAKERDARDPVASRRAFQQAAEIARSLHRPDLLVKAAIGMGKLLAGAGPGIVDHQLVSLIEDALAVVERGDSRDRAILLARLAVDVYWSRNRERALEIGREAVEMARRIGDTATLIAVLDLRQWMLWGPDNLEQRLATASEMVAIAREARDFEALLNAHRARLGAMLEMGEIHEVDAEIAAIENVTRSIGPPSHGYLERFRVMRALMRGELDDAQRWLDRLLTIARERDDRQLLFTHAGQLSALLLERGRASELFPMLSGTSSEVPQLPVVRMAMAVVYARTDRVAQARAEFEYLAAEDFATIPDDWNWLGTLAHLAEVCVKIGELERAPILNRLLGPYAGRGVTLGYGDVYYNSVSHYIALISTALGEFDRARREFEASLRFNRRMGAAVALAYTQAAYGDMLMKGQGFDERRYGADLLRLAREAAEAFGLKALLQEIANSTVLTDEPAQTNSQLVHYSETATFQREGDFWTLSWGKDTVRIRNLKGLHAIAHLLARPCQEIHIAELSQILDHNVFSSDGGNGNSGQRPAHTSADAGPLLDEEAKRAYRTRLRDLRLELSEAEAMNDGGRTDRISSEIGFLQAELLRAIGLGGRNRRGASVSERIRVRVTNAIRSAIVRVAENHPAIGHHLRVSIRTGTLCAYYPDPKTAPSWKL